MSNNLIASLEEIITPIVLADEKEDIHVKDHALRDFYAILLSSLNSNPSLFTKLRDQLSPNIVDIFNGDSSTTQQVLNYISGEVSTAEMNTLLNNAIPPTLNQIVTSAGSSEINIIQFYLNNQMPLVINALPEWASDILESSGVKIEAEKVTEKTTFDDEVEAEAIEMIVEHRNKKRNFLYEFLTLVIIIILFSVIINAVLNYLNS
jgi:hypothetical protein